jgi:nitroreductase
MPLESFTNFHQLIQSRRAVRDFDTTPLDPQTLHLLLDAARWAPSGYNLQPTHLIVAQKPELRRRLQWACLDQRQPAEAPAVVIFAGDREVLKHHFRTVLAMDRETGAIDEKYETLLRQVVPLAFKTGPAKLNWLWKALLPPLARCFRGVPSIPAVERRYWLAKQAGMAAMNFMLTAHAAGLATCPMEGFDPRRLRRVLALPSHVEPILVVPVGRPAGSPPAKTRLSAESLVHWDGW